MRTKTLAMTSMFLMVLVSLAVVSAASFDSGNNFELEIVDDLPATVDAGNTYAVKVNFNNTNSGYTSVNLTLSGSDFSGLVTNYAVAVNTDEDFVLTLDVPSSAINTFSRTLTAEVKNGSTILETLSVDFDAAVNEQSFCEDLGMNDGGELEFSDFDISNDGRGSDDEWEILDEISIDVTVENTDNNDKIEDVVVEVKIVNDNGDDVTNDFDLDDDKIDLGDIKDGDEETATFTIPEVPVDIPEGDYRIYVVAYSDKDDTQCVSSGNDLDNFGSSEYYAEFEVVRDNDNGIIVKDPASVQAACGDQVEVTLELYNIGTDEEESVLVNLYNSELDIDEFVQIDGFRDGKKKTIYFNFPLPNNMKKTFYDFDIVTYYDWDDDEDEMDVTAYDENSEEDLDESYSVRVNIVGSCDSSGSGSSGTGVPTDAPIITAELMSDEVVVGEEVLIKSTLLNPGDSRLDYVVSVEGYSDWAELVGVQPGIVNLESGDSQEVTIRFRPTEAGVQTFTIKLMNSDAEFTQDVSLNVENAPGFNFSGFGSDDQVMYWVAVALVVLIIFLIVLILVVAFRKR